MNRADSDQAGFGTLYLVYVSFSLNMFYNETFCFTSSQCNMSLLIRPSVYFTFITAQRPEFLDQNGIFTVVFALHRLLAIDC